MNFSYYFNNERQTSTDLDFLTELTNDCDNQQEIIDGILASKAAFSVKVDKLSVKMDKIITAFSGE